MKTSHAILPPNTRLSVLIPRPLPEPFDYLAERPLELGTVVKVPFGRKELYGVVWEINETAPKCTLKSLQPLEGGWKLPSVTLQFIHWVSDYTLTSPGQILKMVMPVPEAFEKLPKKKASADPRTPCPPNLSAEQREVGDQLVQAVKVAQFQTCLLEGVTGSGKTEVYFEAIAKVLEGEGQALVMLPEIALSAQWLHRFEKRFGFSPALWHSAVTPTQRCAAYLSILKGEARVVVGARSALFLPFPDLKLIVVDEEHDGSYKQEEGTIYHARDLAVLRARLSDGVCVLSSATPSLETLTNAQAGKYTHLILPQRYGPAQMPEVKIIDMRTVKMAAQTWISPPLRAEIEKKLAANEQIMLFLNRRGYAPVTLCQGCGERVMCPACSLALVHHKSHGNLMCHHCGHIAPVPETCSACGEVGVHTSLGPGVERILEEVETCFPEARTALLTSDHLTTPKKISECMTRIQNHEVDILIGTQIMAKGHHFPLLTLVGILDGDGALSGSDLRAAEKSFQLLHQVSGRSGRADKPGHVFLQTHLADHPLMKALVRHDSAAFLALEAEQRQFHGFPPYGRLVALIVSGTREEEVEQGARLLARTFPHQSAMELLGPVPAPLFFLRGNYRWRLLLRSPKTMAPQALLRAWIKGTPLSTSLKLQVDVDPYSFL